jgi:hypothetical protein
LLNNLQKKGKNQNKQTYIYNPILQLLNKLKFLKQLKYKLILTFLNDKKIYFYNFNGLIFSSF